MAKLFSKCEIELSLLARFRTFMRLDFYLGCKDLMESIFFYAEELGYFYLSQDFGGGSVLLRCRQHRNFALILSEDVGVVPHGAPVFGVSVDNCKAEFARLRGTSFRGINAGIDGEGAEGKLFEYPLGCNFVIRDPTGHSVLVSEWRGGDDQDDPFAWQSVQSSLD